MAQKNLSKITISKLKEMALEIGGIEGVSGMTKQQLIEAIKAAKENPAPLPTIQKAEVDVKALKTQIKSLKAEKEIALTNCDRKALKELRRKIKRLKRLTRQAS
jgi:hypothetical protein